MWNEIKNPLFFICIGLSDKYKCENHNKSKDRELLEFDNENGGNRIVGLNELRRTMYKNLKEKDKKRNGERISPRAMISTIQIIVLFSFEKSQCNSALEKRELQNANESTITTTINDNNNNNNKEDEPKNIFQIKPFCLKHNTLFNGELPFESFEEKIFFDKNKLWIAKKFELDYIVFKKVNPEEKHKLQFESGFGFESKSKSKLNKMDPLIKEKTKDLGENFSMESTMELNTFKNIFEITKDEKETTNITDATAFAFDANMNSMEEEFEYMRSKNVKRKQTETNYLQKELVSFSNLQRYNPIKIPKREKEEIVDKSDDHNDDEKEEEEGKKDGDWQEEKKDLNYYHSFYNLKKPTLTNIRITQPLREFRILKKRQLLEPSIIYKPGCKISPMEINEKQNEKQNIRNEIQHQKQNKQNARNDANCFAKTTKFSLARNTAPTAFTPLTTSISSISIPLSIPVISIDNNENENRNGENKQIQKMQETQDIKMTDKGSISMRFICMKKKSLECSICGEEFSECPWMRIENRSATLYDLWQEWKLNSKISATTFKNWILLNPCKIESHAICIQCLIKCITDKYRRIVSDSNPYIKCLSTFPCDSVYECEWFKCLLEDVDYLYLKDCYDKYFLPGSRCIECPLQYFQKVDGRFIQLYCGSKCIIQKEKIETATPGRLIVSCTQNSNCMQTFCYHCKKKTSFSRQCFACEKYSRDTSPESFNMFFYKPQLESGLKCLGSSNSKLECFHLMKNKDISIEIATNQIKKVIECTPFAMPCLICGALLDKSTACSELTHCRVKKCYICGENTFVDALSFHQSHWGNSWSNESKCPRYNTDYKSLKSYRCIDGVCFTEKKMCKIQNHMEGIEELQLLRRQKHVESRLLSLLPDVMMEVISTLNSLLSENTASLEIFNKAISSKSIQDKIKIQNRNQIQIKNQIQIQTQNATDSSCEKKNSDLYCRENKLNMDLLRKNESTIETNSYQRRKHKGWQIDSLLPFDSLEKPIKKSNLTMMQIDFSKPNNESQKDYSNKTIMKTIERKEN